MCRYDEFDVADRLRQRGWVVPAYTMAPGAEVIADIILLQPAPNICLMLHCVKDLLQSHAEPLRPLPETLKQHVSSEAGRCMRGTYDMSTHQICACAGHPCAARAVPRGVFCGSCKDFCGGPEARYAVAHRPLPVHSRAGDFVPTRPRCNSIHSNSLRLRGAQQASRAQGCLCIIQLVCSE